MVARGTPRPPRAPPRLSAVIVRLKSLIHQMLAVVGRYSSIAAKLAIDRPRPPPPPLRSSSNHRLTDSDIPIESLAHYAAKQSQQQQQHKQYQCAISGRQ